MGSADKQRGVDERRVSAKIRVLNCQDQRTWRNWQTRQTKDLVLNCEGGGSNPLVRTAKHGVSDNSREHRFFMECPPVINLLATFRRHQRRNIDAWR